MGSCNFQNISAPKTHPLHAQNNSKPTIHLCYVITLRCTHIRLVNTEYESLKLKWLDYQTRPAIKKRKIKEKLMRYKSSTSIYITIGNTVP